MGVDVQYQGTAAIVTMRFYLPAPDTAPSPGTPIDPETVSAWFEVAQTATTLTYGTGDEITRLGVGEYQFEITTWTAKGTTWTGQVQGKGNGCTVVEPFAFHRALPPKVTA